MFTVNNEGQDCKTQSPAGTNTSCKAAITEPEPMSDETDTTESTMDVAERATEHISKEPNASGAINSSMDVEKSHSEAIPQDSKADIHFGSAADNQPSPGGVDVVADNHSGGAASDADAVDFATLSKRRSEDGSGLDWMQQLMAKINQAADEKGLCSFDNNFQ